MSSTNISKEIQKRIENAEEGSIFVCADFLDISSSSRIGVVLSRMNEHGSIRRLMQGVYEKPIYNEFLGEYVSASPNKIAKAIARNYGWSISPYGDTALNSLGLSTQVPATFIYASDGAYKEYFCENINIKFKHTATRDISKLSNKTALVIQALKALGKANVDYIVIQKLRLILSKEEKTIMLKEAAGVTSWVYGFIKQICESENNEKYS